MLHSSFYPFLNILSQRCQQHCLWAYLRLAVGLFWGQVEMSVSPTGTALFSSHTGHPCTFTSLTKPWHINSQRSVHTLLENYAIALEANWSNSRVYNSKLCAPMLQSEVTAYHLPSSHSGASFHCSISHVCTKSVQALCDGLSLKSLTLTQQKGNLSNKAIVCLYFESFFKATMFKAFPLFVCSQNYI